MREIRFRAWSKKDKILHKPQTLQEIHSKGIGLPQNDRIVMQYTGLKDKKGKEIYEGDIVETDKFSGIIGKFDEIKGIIVFNHGQFRVQYGFDLCLYCELHGNSLIIGNKYKNPNLLTPSQTKESGKK